jgi:hypothetical protein
MKFFFASLAVLLCYQVHAQEIKGKITDEKETDLSGATIYTKYALYRRILFVYLCMGRKAILDIENKFQKQVPLLHKSQGSDITFKTKIFYVDNYANQHHYIFRGRE